MSLEASVLIVSQLWYFEPAVEPVHHTSAKYLPGTTLMPANKISQRARESNRGTKAKKGRWGGGKEVAAEQSRLISVLHLLRASVPYKHRDQLVLGYVWFVATRSGLIG